MPNIGTQIQTWVRLYADDSTIDLTTGNGLLILNEIYHGMFNPDYCMYFGGIEMRIGRNWPEAYVSSDLGVNTTSGTASYNWLTTTKYRDDPIVELETAAGSGLYDQVLPCPDEETWRRHVNNSNSRPVVYRRSGIQGAMKIEFAPTPSVSSLDIILRGATEITKFTTTTVSDGTTKTNFFNEEPDQALAYLIAATYKAQRGDTGRAIDLAKTGLGLLSATDRMPAHDDNTIVSHYL